MGSGAQGAGAFFCLPLPLLRVRAAFWPTLPSTVAAALPAPALSLPLPLTPLPAVLAAFLFAPLPTLVSAVACARSCYFQLPTCGDDKTHAHP